MVPEVFVLRGCCGATGTQSEEDVQEVYTVIHTNEYKLALHCKVKEAYKLCKKLFMLLSWYNGQETVLIHRLLTTTYKQAQQREVLLC